MRSWKRILWGTLAAAVLGLAWASHSGWLLGAARQGLEDGLHQATGREVHVARVTGGFSGWVWLEDISMGPAADGRRPDVSVTAERVGLKLDWVRLVLHRQASLQDLQAVQVRDAQAYVLLPRVEAADLSPSAQAPAKDPLASLRQGLRNAPLPPVRLQLRRGHIWVQRPGQAPSLWLDQAELEAQPAAGRLKVEGSGIGLGGASLQLSGEGDESLRQAQARVAFKRLPLGLLALPDGLSLSAGTLEGEVSVLAAPGLPGPWPGLRLEGSGRLEEGALRWRDRNAVEQAQARWALAGQRLQVSAVQAVAAQGRWKGEASLDLGAGSLEAKASTAGLGLAALAQLAGAPAGLSLTGQVAADFEASGALSATALSLTLHSKLAQWRGQALDDLDVRWDRGGTGAQSVDARLAWQDGQAHAEAALDASGAHHGSVDVQGLRADWLEAWTGVSMTGRVGGQGQWSGSAQGLTWEAKAATEDLSMGSLDVKRASLQGWGDSKALHGRLEGDALGWKGLNAEMDARLAPDGAWALKAAKVFVGDKLLAQADGQGRPDAAGLWQGEWRVKAGPWPAGDLPFSRGLSGISGTVQAQGSLRLVDSRYDWQASVDAPGLMRGANAAALHAKAAGCEGSVSVTALNLRHGELTGDVYWQAPGRLSGALQVQQADLGAMVAIAGLRADSLTGTATGKLEWVKDRGQRSGKAELSVAGLSWGPLQASQASLRGSLAGPRWTLEQWKAEQGASATWSANGSLDLTGHEAWAGHSDWAQWRWGRGTWDGQAALSGGEGSAARLQVSGLRLSGTAQPDLKADLRFESDEPSSLSFDWGAGLSVKGRRGPKGWEALADLQRQDLGLLAGVWLGRPLSTGVSWNGELKFERWGEADEGVSADLEEAANGAKGKGSFKGQGARSASTAAWTGQAEWAALDLAALQRSWVAALQGPDLGLAGLASGRLEASPSGLSVTSQLKGFNLEGVAFGPGSLQGAWAEGGLRVDALDLGGSGPRLSLKKAHLSRAKGAWNAEGELEAADVPYSLFSLSGKGRFKASGKAATGKLSSDWIWAQVGERRFDALGLDLAWNGGSWALAPRSGKEFKASGRLQGSDFILSSLESREGHGSASLKGEVLGSGALSFDGQATGFPVGELTACLGWPQEWKGAAYGSLSVRGDTSTARSVISLKIEDGSVQGLAFDLAQAVVHVEDGWVRLAPLGPIKLMRKDAYDLEVDGSIPLQDAQGKPSGPLDVRARLKDGGLGFLASLPGIKAARGPLDLDLRFSGDSGDPTVNGSLKVSGGTLTPAWLLPPLEKVDLFAQIQDGQVQLQQAQARVVNNGPLLRLELVEARQPAFVLEHWVPQRFNLRLRASASGLPVRSTAQLRFLDGTLHPDLVLQGGWSQPAVSGLVSLDRGDLDKAIITWPPQFSTPQSHAPDDAEPGFLDRIDWDLKLSARKDVMLRNDLVQVFVDTGEHGLHLSGAGSHRSLEGRLAAIKGSLDYSFTSFDLATDKLSWVDFLGEDAPQLELWGTKQVRDALINGQSARRDVTVLLHASGPLGQVQMTLDTDDATLNQEQNQEQKQAQLASLAGFGIDSTDQRNQGGFARLLGQAPAAVLTRYARRTGLIDEVGVRLPVVEDAMAGSPQSSSPGAQAAASDVTGTSRPLVEVSLGKWVTQKLFVGLNGQVNQHQDSVRGSSVDPAFGGSVEYQLNNDARVSAQQEVDPDGLPEQRVMLERASSFENYNPRKRRWGRYDLTVTPTPGVDDGKSPVK